MHSRLAYMGLMVVGWSVLFGPAMANAWTGTGLVNSDYYSKFFNHSPNIHQNHEYQMRDDDCLLIESDYKEKYGEVVYNSYAETKVAKKFCLNDLIGRKIKAALGNCGLPEYTIANETTRDSTTTVRTRKNVGIRMGCECTYSSQTITDYADPSDPFGHADNNFSEVKGQHADAPLVQCLEFFSLEDQKIIRKIVNETIKENE